MNIFKSKAMCLERDLILGKIQGREIKDLDSLQNVRDCRCIRVVVYHLR